MSITIDPRLNPLEVILVEEHMRSRGVNHYAMIPGNACIWVYYGSMNLYFIFDNGRIVDVQID